MSARYEQLRAFALGAGGDAEGLVVFLRGGVVTWLRAQASASRVAQSEPESAKHREARMDPERAELVFLLASIISQHLSEKAA